MKMIKLHSNGIPIYFNSDQIICLEADEDNYYEKTILYLKGSSISWRIDESPKKIIELLNCTISSV